MSWLRNVFGLSSERPLYRVVEFDLGENDIVILTTAEHITTAHANEIKHACEEAMRKPGRITLVISGGMTVQVAYRSDVRAGVGR